ncbi:MAG: hypothetical protein IJW19_05315 [Clostridia bacterium]|nr:hypothetical protein [Clostridia bacterium]
MKKLCILLAVIMLGIALVGCSTEDATTTTANQGGSQNTGTQNKNINTVAKMTELDSVYSVTLNTEYTSDDFLVYDLILLSDGLKLRAEMVLPRDYQLKNYTTVMYFPEIGRYYEYLIDGFGRSGYIVIRLSARGLEGSEGVRDVCGKDYADAEMLLKICQSCDFLSRGGIVAAGSGEGSVKALKLASEHSDEIKGCAVIDVISDYESLIEVRGEGIKQLMETLIGGSITEMPEEYRKRSAVYFADKIDTPMLILAYKDHPLCPEEQGTMLRDAINNAGGTCTYISIDQISSDFYNEYAFSHLVQWMAALPND